MSEADSKVISLVVNADRSAVARAIMADLLRSCRDASKLAGDRLSGFALVTWDGDGNLRSSYNAENGIIGPALVPTLAQDALNRHVAVKLASAETERQGG